MSDDGLPTRRGRGRPVLPESEQRRHAVTCRLTDDERDRVDAARGGVTRGEYIRLAALARPPRVVPELNRAAWTDLARAAANLNQIAKIANQTGKVSGGRELIQLRDNVEAVRRLLLGISPPGGGPDDES